MTDPVASHYGSEGLTGRIQEALTAAGFDLADLDSAVLSGVDEFHLGGRAATEALLDSVAPEPGWTVVDVGCGIGGAARVMAQRGCTVLGIDLTPPFVETAHRLTEAVGLGDRARFEIGSALELPLGEAEVDLATVLHVGMNIEDKTALMAELSRVVRPGGSLAVYDIMRVGEGEITFPVPWASEPGHSFVATVDDYVAAIGAAGWSDIEVTPRLDLVLDVIAAQRSGPPAAVDLGHLMGPDLRIMFGNLFPLLHGGVLAPIQILGRR